MAVVIYTDADFGGQSHELGVGKYNINFPSVGDDTISSIRVPDGWTVFAYADPDCEGEVRKYTASTNSLGGFDDRISSIVVHDESIDAGTVDASLLGQFTIDIAPGRVAGL